MATYNKIIERVLTQQGLTVSSCEVADVKHRLSLKMRDAHNQKDPTEVAKPCKSPVKWAATEAALRHYKIVK